MADLNGKVIGLYIYFTCHEFTGNGSDLCGRRQPRKEFANEDFPVPEAPKTKICEQKLPREMGIDYLSRKNAWKSC